LDIPVVVIFVLVYLGMMLGRIPGLALDRTGVALLGAIALMALGRVRTDDVWAAVDIPTIAVLFGLMVVSAQFRLSGFYSQVTRRLAAARVSPAVLLLLLVGLVGILSAILANDIVCLAMAPLLAAGCSGRGLNPRPYLLALACAANVGSAATLIGNPQNILIGEVMRLSFVGYLGAAAIPSVLGLGVVWAVIALTFRGQWRRPPQETRVDAPVHDRWQTGKGVAVVGLLVAVFLAAPVPRDMAALAAAGILLCSRRMRSREMLGLIDWQLLVLFISLFVVNHALSASGSSGGLVHLLERAGIRIGDPAWLFGLSVILSNLVSNVPAVMLLLPSASGALDGQVLALASTLAGNLLIVGSIANIIVVDQAGRVGIKIGWKEHARVGVPVTLFTLAIAAAWLALVGR
jgi:Na+/H+ antiporter NhaD/arsenite permease-like protein